MILNHVVWIVYLTNLNWKGFATDGELYLSKVIQSHNRIASKNYGNAFYILLSLVPALSYWINDNMLNNMNTNVGKFALVERSQLQSEHCYLCSDWEKAAIKKRITSLSCLTYCNLTPLLLLLLRNEQYWKRIITLLSCGFHSSTQIQPLDWYGMGSRNNLRFLCKNMSLTVSGFSLAHFEKKMKATKTK